MNGIIIQGSARSNGNTHKIAQFLLQRGDFDFIDLKEKQIAEFDYEHQNRQDDFLPLIRKLVAEYDLFVFATPVYWYSMSGIMKTFFDRISDCLKIEKETGRKLRGKKMAMFCCSSDEEVFPEFNMPFKRSAEYLGMQYLGDVHTWIEGTTIPEKVQQELLLFLEKLR